MSQMTGEQVAQVLYQAGFRGEDLVRFTGLGRRESSWNPSAHRTDRDPSAMSGDLGLLQINYTNWDLVSSRLGLTSKDQLFDPLTNARAAKVLFDEYGYSPWTMGPNGWTASGDPMYGVNLERARSAVSNAESSGMLGQAYAGDQQSSARVQTTGQEFAGGKITLPSDADVFRRNGNWFVLFDMGGVVLQYNVADPSKFNLPPNAPDYSDAAGTAKLEAMNRVYAGHAAELATIGASFGDFKSFWDSLVMTVMGANNPARNDPGVLAVLAEYAGRPDMTEAELQNRLQATQWFQDRTQAELSWNSLSEAERESQREDMRSRMADTYFQFAGERPDTDDPRIRNYLEDVASGKMGYGAFTEIVKQYALDNGESPWSRQIRAEEEEQRKRPVDIENTRQRIRETMERWGLQWSNNTIHDWAKGIVEKTKSDEDLLLQMRNEAAAMYPWKDPEMETATAAAPWLETYRRTMEQSATVLTDEVQRSLQSQESPWEMEQRLKKTDAWLGTQNGQEAVIGIGSELGRRMGFV